MSVTSVMPFLWCPAHTYMKSLSTISVTYVRGTASESKFLPLNFNTSFQFVFHKKRPTYLFQQISYSINWVWWVQHAEKYERYIPTIVKSQSGCSHSSFFALWRTRVFYTTIRKAKASWRHDWLVTVVLFFSFFLSCCVVCLLVSVFYFEAR
jgi:hypothetical protein